MAAAGSINMSLKHPQALSRAHDGPWHGARARRQRAGARQAVITTRHCRLKRIECTLLLKHLTGMGSPKTALGLMTPVAYEVRTGVHCGHCKRNPIG